MGSSVTELYCWFHDSNIVQIRRNKRGRSLEDSKIALWNMVDCQLRPNLVSDPDVIEAFLKVPRDRFVPEHLKTIAYSDRNIDIGGGRVLMAPMFFGKILQHCAISPGEIVLDVACGSGYACAVLSRLAGTVIGLESSSSLVTEVSKLLTDLSVDNAVVVSGELREGLEEEGPYDVIIVEGAVGVFPKSYEKQLASGGRLVLFERLENGNGQAVVYLKHANTLSRRVLFDAVLPFLPEFVAESGFVF